MSLPYYASSYRTYREAIDQITSWLCNTARRCEGEDLAYLNATFTHGQNFVKLDKLVSLSQIIARSSAPDKVHFPANINNVLRELLCSRQAFAKKLALRDDQPHLIAVLGQVLAILEPPLEEVKNEAQVNGDRPSSSSSKVDSHEAQGCEVETEPNIEFNLQLSETEKVFVVYAILKDCNNVRQAVSSLWRDFKERGLDLMTAAVTTDIAFAILKSNFEEITEADIGIDNYDDMVSILKKYLHHTGCSNAEVLEWTCSGTATILEEFERLLQVTKGMPVVIDGAMGRYEPQKDRSNLSAEAQQAEDRTVLLELLPEFAYLARDRFGFPSQDLLTTALKQMAAARSTKALPAFAFFATQILLDIHHILRDQTGRAFAELQDTAKKIVKTINDYLRSSRDRTSIFWAPEHNEMLKNVRNFARDWALTDQVGAISRGALRGTASRPFYLLKNHPVLCGLLTYRLNVLMSDIGLALCNAWCTALTAAHVHNAVFQMGYLKQTWDHMEFFLAAHSPEKIFIGSPPGKPVEFRERFYLALGASLEQAGAANPVNVDELVNDTIRRSHGVKLFSSVRQIFRSWYVEDATTTLTDESVLALMTMSSEMPNQTEPYRYDSIRLIQKIRKGMVIDRSAILFEYFGFHQQGYTVLSNIKNSLYDEMAKHVRPSGTEGEDRLLYAVGVLFDSVARGDEIGHELLQQSSCIFNRFAQDTHERDASQNGIVT